jgi:hypothetical protein
MPVNLTRRLGEITGGLSNTLHLGECAGRPEVWRAGRRVRQ